MAEGAELTLGVLFAGRVDESFRRETNRLREILSGLASRMGTAGAAADSMRSKSKRMGDEFSDVGKKLSKIEGGFQRLTNAIKVTASYGLAATFLFGVINGLKQGTQEIANFDQALKNLQAITSATDFEILALRETILDVAEKTRYSADEISQAAVTLGQAGFTAAESLDALQSVANLSTGTLSSMAEVSDLMTSALRAFGESAQQSSRYADIFASAINKSKLDVQKLRIAFNYLGPVASQVGLDLENAAAATMLLANAGLRGSTIGTGLRRVLQLLVAPTEKLKVLFASVGADLDKLNPAVSSMSDVVGELQKLLGDTVEPTERARRAFELFGLRGANVAAALGQAGKAGFEAMLREVYRVGTASQMAEKQMEGIATMAKNLKDRMVNLAIAIGEGGIADALRMLLPALRQTVSVLTDLADSTVGRAIVAFTTLTTVLALLRITMKYVIVQLVAMAASMSIANVRAYAAAHGLLATALLGVRSAAAKLFLLLKTNPWFLLATAISAAAVAMYSYLRYQKELIPNLEKEGVQLSLALNKLTDYEHRLSQTSEGSMEYRAILERLIEDHPELASKIDLVNGKFLDQGKALEELIEKYKLLRIENLARTFSQYLEDLHKIEKQIQAYEQLIERNAKETAFVRRQSASLDKLKKKYIELKDVQEAVFTRIGAMLLEMGLTTSASFEQIRDTIIATFGLGKKEAEELALYVMGYFDRVKLMSETARRSAAEALASQEDLLAAYGEKWLALYRRLDDLRKADLIETVYDMQEKIDKMEETAEKQGWTEEQLQARIRELMDETLRNFMEKESAKERRARRTAAEIQEAYLKSFKRQEEAAIASAKAQAADRAQKVKESVTDAEERARLLKQIEETLKNDLLAIHEEYSRERKELVSDITRYYLRSTKETVEAEIEAAKQKADALKERVENEIRDAELRRRLLAQIEAALQADILRIQQRAADKSMGSRREKILSLEEEYRMRLITIEEYYAELDRLAEENLISERQWAEQRERIQENMFNAFYDGLRRSQREFLTWSEFMYEVGRDLSYKLSDGLTDALLAFSDSTKEAKEAWIDFAKNFIKWIAEMIIRQTILNALRGISFGGGGGGGTTGALPSNIAFNQPHSGGKIGSKQFAKRWVDPSVFAFAPRLHNGLRSNEIPAIIEKGEEVISKRDVKEREKGSKDPVQVVINEAPPGTKVTKEQEGGGNIKKIIIDLNTSDIVGGGSLDKTLQRVYGLRRVTKKR